VTDIINILVIQVLMNNIFITVLSCMQM